MPIVRKTVRVTDFEPTPIDPSRIRCRGLAFSPGVRVWIEAVTSQGKKLKALPQVKIGISRAPKGGHEDADTAKGPEISARPEDFISTPFPDGIPWGKLPPLAVDAFASMVEISDWGYDGYCELLAGIQMASVARLRFDRVRGNKVRIRLRIGDETFELLISASNLAPFLREEPVPILEAAAPGTPSEPDPP